MSFNNKIKIVPTIDLNEIFKNPEKYIDESNDMLLARVTNPLLGNRDPIIIMIGYDGPKYGYYIVIEDDYTSTYEHCKKSKLKETFKSVLLSAIGLEES